MYAHKNASFPRSGVGMQAWSLQRHQQHQTSIAINPRLPRLKSGT